MIKNIGIFLGHPAHFHNMKNVAENLKRDGYNVFFAIKEKDILSDLCREAGYPFFRLREGRGNSKWALVKSVLGMEYLMVKFIRQKKIDLLIGTTLSFAAAKICRIPVFAIAEDDHYIAPRYAKMVYPYATSVLSPVTCDNGKWEYKTVHYPGFQKLAYLHPKRFIADKSIVEQYGIDPEKPYFLMRFAKLNAHHDNGVSGISTEIAQRLVDILSPHGKIYITSERELEPQFEKYRLQINPLDIHHVMAFATLYIGDSQSMAVEAAMLGVPGVRFNDFVGKKKIGVMEELEHVYGLTYGISSHEPERLYAKIEELMAMPNLREEFQSRRAKMLSEKIDVTAFFTWYLENYPASAELSRKADKAFWERFR